MSTYKILILWIALLFSACEWKSSRGKNTVIKNTVYVIETKKDTIRPIISSSPDTSYLDIVFRNNGMVDIQSLDTSIRIHLRYADTSNFLHLNVLLQFLLTMAPYSFLVDILECIEDQIPYAQLLAPLQSHH